MSPTARQATGEPTVLASYRSNQGTRQLFGQRINGMVAVSDIPAGGHGKVHLVERHCRQLPSSTGSWPTTSP